MIALVYRRHLWENELGMKEFFLDWNVKSVEEANSPLPKRLVREKSRKIKMIR